MNLHSNNKVDEFISEIMILTTKKRQELLTEILEEKGLDYDLDYEQESRFKTLHREIKDGTEYYYYNDGSPEGMFLFRFTPNIGIEGDSMRLTFDVSYLNK